MNPAADGVCYQVPLPASICTLALSVEPILTWHSIASGNRKTATPKEVGPKLPHQHPLLLEVARETGIFL